jgi:hypothetical protein
MATTRSPILTRDQVFHNDDVLSRLGYGSVDQFALTVAGDGDDFHALAH